MPAELPVDRALDEWATVVPAFLDGTVGRILETVEHRREGTVVYPAPDSLFRAMVLTPLSAVRVVILGQDPYHGSGQAHGLSFSVPEGIPAPPSLRNIFREITDDIYGGIPQQFSTNLTRWAVQGVLLLNTVLTVEQGRAGSHRGLGWETVTDQIIAAVSRACPHPVFMLWGAPARKKRALVDRDSCCLLEAPHPSPLSSYRGFFGCRHFSLANTWLEEHGLLPIRW